MRILNNLFVFGLLLSSCQSEPTKSNATQSENLDSEKTLVVPWNVVTNDSTHTMEIRRDPAADMAYLEAADIVDALNIKYPEIKLHWEKLEGNKALVSISEPLYLTQQSGSQGAQAYLAEATYSLTEVKGIVAVEFRFEEGDHAQPGVYTREDFQF